MMPVSQHLRAFVVLVLGSLACTLAQATSERITFLNHSFDAFIVNANELTFLWKDNENNKFLSFEKVNQYVKNQGKELIFATNAGIFTHEYIPEGLFVENGTEEVSINLKSRNGNFYMNFGNEDRSNGVFIIDKSGNARIIKAKDYNKYKQSTKSATQSGPLLLYNGKINPNFNKDSSNLKIRSGVGLISSTEAVFIISNNPVNFHDFAAIFRDKYNCTHALYLDGVISKMYLPEINRMDNGGNFSGIIGVIK